MGAAQDDAESMPFQLTETDRQHLAGGDENYVFHDWEDLKEIIAANNLSILKRKPSDLRRYIKWTNETKREYGSMTNFVCQERLHWTPLTSSTTETGPLFACEMERPFASPNDYKILLNDWPYGLSPDITHLVVWLKTRIPVQLPEGYLTPESSRLVEDFVQKTFVDKLKEAGQGQDQVQWFKNWVSLQSIPGLEHIHVLVRNVPQNILNGWITSSTPAA